MAFMIIGLLSECSSGYDISLTITGATGVLGRALTRNAVRRMKSGRIHLLHRNKVQHAELLKIIHLEKLDELCEHAPVLTSYYCDLQKLSVQSACSAWDSIEVESTHGALINCAGVFLSGNSLAVAEQSLRCNTLAPILLTQQLLRKSHPAQQNKTTVVNIGSGDGEQVFISPSIIKQLNDLHSVDDLVKYVHRLLTNHDEHFEYAHGDTPWYSLSKCLLHRATALFHNEVCEQHNHIRVICICPGNFVSPMTTTEELSDLTSSFVDCDTAASYVLSAIDNQMFTTVSDHRPSSSMCLESGKFYRFGKEISW